MPKPKSQSEETHQTHIYLSKEDHAALKRRAVSEARSVNGQILHYVRRGLEQDTRAKA